MSSTSRSARKVCQLFIDQDVPIRTVLKGDLIPVGSSCIARVLHPACAVDTARISDNENSIVLEVSLDSKHVLFTGALLSKEVIPKKVMNLVASLTQTKPSKVLISAVLFQEKAVSSWRVASHSRVAR